MTAADPCRDCGDTITNYSTKHSAWLCLDCFSAASRATTAAGSRTCEVDVAQTLDVGRCLTEPAKGEVEELLRAWRAGEKTPLPMAHNPLPADVPEPVHRVAEFFLAVRGLRAGELIDAPVPFTERWVAEQPEIAGLSHATAGRAILKLRHEYAYFYKAGERPASEKHLKPVFLYELCPAPAVAVEDAAAVVGEPDEVEVPVVGEPVVALAEGAAGAGADGGVAGGGVAGGGAAGDGLAAAVRGAAPAAGADVEASPDRGEVVVHAANSRSASGDEGGRS